MSLLDTALSYTGAGWPIFPLEPHGKRPLGKLAPHGLKDATLEEDIVRRWWKTEPQANIAIPTGIVFDVGDVDSAEALGRFQELCREHDTDPAAFPRAKTGRGGRHIFVAPTGVGNKVDVIQGMDWRGKGGYVVVPDSVHPSGITYEWILRVSDKPPPCPDWLLALITRPVLIRPSVVSEIAPEAYVNAAVEAEMRKLRSAPIGQRNDQLNRSSFALGQLVGANWLERGRAEAELRAAAHAIDHGHEPGLTATIMSGLEAGRLEPRKAPLEGWGTAGVIRQGVQSEGGKVAATAPANPAADSISARPDVYSLADLEAMEIPEPKMIVPGVLYVGLNMLVGKSKLGKSWLALSTALAVAQGGKVLDKIQVDAGEVLYMALEDNKGRMKSRTNLLLEGAKFPKGLFVAHDWPKLDEGGLQVMEMWLDEHPAASLLIIDVWARMRPKRRKNGDLYAEDYDHLVPLQALARRNGVAVLVVHHTRKAAGEDVYDEILGTGGIMAALDACIVLHRARGEADAEIFITGRELEEARLALKFEGAKWSLMGQAGDVARSRERRGVIDVITGNGGPITVSEVAVALGKSPNTIRQLMWKMLTAGELARGPNTTYTLPITTITSNSSNSDNSSNSQRGMGVTGVTGVLTRVRARRGCPACGTLAYSWQGHRRKCHECGTLYDSPAGGTTTEMSE